MDLAELERLCAERHLQGHWNIEREERTSLAPYLWKGADMLSGLMRAAELVGKDMINTRLVQPKHPSLPWGMSNTIHCTVQCMMPGERTKGHRTVGSETRFVIKGAPGAAFVIQGEAFPIEEGDFITTPGWAWHDHYNEGSEPVVWMDGMENRLVSLGGQVGEPVPGDYQQVSKPEGFSLRMQGHVRPSWIKSDLPTPPARYRWTDTYASLMMLKESGAPGDPYDGIYLQYSNPLSGGPTLPTRTFGMHLFTPGLRTSPRRRNCTTIYYGFRGQGVLEAGDERFEWTQGDLIVVPPWTRQAHENRSEADALLFSISDRPTMVALDLYREDAG